MLDSPVHFIPSMNPTGFQQTLGNICVGLAAVLYALPLQLLLRELARKRDDGGGVLAGMLIIIPMWLLLTVALLCVTSSGGFNWIRINRTLLNVLTVLAALMMAALSFLRFEFARPASLVDKLIGGVPIHLFPLLTILLVVVSLNPRLTMGLPVQMVNVLWTVIAAIDLTVGGGFVAYKLLSKAGNQVAAVSHNIGWGGEVRRENLARIPLLDPTRDFTELVRLSGENSGDGVREVAMARLRLNPEFVTRLAAELTDATPSSGEAEHALEAVDFGTFTADEQKVLALPARSAMERITRYIREELRYFTKERRSGVQKQTGRLFKSVAEKLAGTGVDFQPAIRAFEQTLGD